ncbi:arrestin domain-containing protein 2-like isoform X2 [Cimex lectularius]|uniref:Arrestin C-terminal-like domain-containing protein n=1 Tax=Cimex lectularius TaxID=79782 RepID=A0A8I6TG44_CIMLE|nr:arrestin domain-containing protein 2-like isoform X2 [Cimex lectularius]
MSVRIVLDCETDSFIAGSEITGNVKIDLDKPHYARGLVVKLEGLAKLSWIEPYKTKLGLLRKFKFVKYSSEETYLTSKFYLVGHSTGRVYFPSGENVFKFKVSVPLHLPSSFEGGRGYVRYSISAFIDIPGKTEHEATSPITIIMPRAPKEELMTTKAPVKKDVQKTIRRCSCLRSGNLSLQVSIPQKFFNLSETIPVIIDMDNSSTSNVEKIDCKIEKRTEWVAQQPRNNSIVDSIVLVGIELDGVGPDATKSYSVKLAIPGTPLINIDNCSIISIVFVLKVAAFVKEPVQNLVAEIPLIILNPDESCTKYLENIKSTDEVVQTKNELGQSFGKNSMEKMHAQERAKKPLGKVTACSRQSNL